MIRLSLALLAVTWGISGVCQAQDAKSQASAAPQSFHTAKGNSPAPGTIFIYPERFPLRDGGLFTAERGLVFVPLNRSKSESDVIAIEFYRFPRSDRADQNAPPMFLLNGGPGFEGLEQDLREPGLFERRLQQFLDISDVIVVGQRGIGSSKPHTLIEMEVATQAANESHDDNEDSDKMFTESLARERQFWLDQGVDLTGFNVLECATDVRDVAQALGYEKIVIFGGSFGSHWGMAILRKHPEIVARAVLHGNEGPDHTWDHPGWLWNVYKRVAEEAEQDETLKPYIPEGGLIKAAEDLVKQATDKPFTVSFTDNTGETREVLVDRFVMQQLVRGYTRHLPAWPAEIIKMHNGDFQDAARAAYQFFSGAQQRQFSTASYWMLDSGSGITPERRAEFEADPALDVIGSTFDWYANGSPIWEDADLGDDFRQNFETDIPTVMIHGTWDVSTPYENGLELAPYFKNSKFITVHHGSHGAISEALRADANFRNAIIKFMVSGDMSDCPAEVQLPTEPWRVPDLKREDK